MQIESKFRNRRRGIEMVSHPKQDVLPLLLRIEF